MEIHYYDSNVEKFIDRWDLQTRAKIAREMRYLRELGFALRMPHSKMLEQDIFELRIHGRQEIRMLYTFYRGCAYVLHTFQKKTRRTPRAEIAIARNLRFLLEKR